MGDLQITPETPGRPAIHNPFESPNDYHRLQESVVPSPSVFKSSKSSGATPAKFKWDIDEMSSLLPVHIDAEDIHRQSMYLSQTRIDTDIEEKRQNAIEQFFTNGAIVPSPWTEQASKQKSAQMHFGKSSMSPQILEEPLPTKKTTVGCQTVLSLPVDFQLDKILGEYYRSEEASQHDQVQESLSSSSLRRKLFLDGHGSGSESSSPPSPERGGGEGEPPGGEGGGDRDFLSPMSASPLPCLLSGMSALTPSTGLLSSSPIQGRHRTYSLGSVTSPQFPERSSPAGFKSPALSPIGPQFTQTPIAGERKKLSFVTPEGVPLDMDMNSCTESPYVDGCSPIRFCSPLQLPGQTQDNPKLRLRARCWASPPTISPNPSLPGQTQDNPKLRLEPAAGPHPQRSPPNPSLPGQTQDNPKLRLRARCWASPPTISPNPFPPGPDPGQPQAQTPSPLLGLTPNDLPQPFPPGPDPGQPQAQTPSPLLGLTPNDLPQPFPPGPDPGQPQAQTPSPLLGLTPNHLPPTLPFLDQENICPSTPLPPMELGSPLQCVPRTSEGLLGPGRLCEGGPGMAQPLSDSVKMEEENGEVEVELPEEEEEGGVTPVGVRLTSSRVGASVLAAEASHMFVSLLAEGSSIPYDNSMQVDSGYNTYAGTATASLIDGMSSDSQSKESFDAAHIPDEVFPYTRHTKTIFPQHH
ncbi:protein aurora borealis-like [Coregonus clupeaformis]|uniref:protein aurora borealis-like n=1 Tax=Coregonus clupeaformis TaxID=59861 RepID=UPI001E1C46AC|nr:protein aurora borealis-like [Coregonus clupeaformis]